MEIRESILAPRGARKDAQPADLRNLAEVLRDEHPDVNIVVSPGVSRIAIDDLKLRAASLEDELEALCVASGGQFIWEKRGGSVPGFGAPDMVGPPGLAIATAGGSQSSLYILHEPNVPVESRRKAEAFNLSGYLQSSGVPAAPGAAVSPVADRLKEIEEIVAQTLEAIGGGQANQDRPRFMFHAGANLLVVIGPPQAIEVARQVVNALPGQQPVMAPGGGMPGRYGPFGPGGGYGGGIGGGPPPGAGGGMGPVGPGASVMVVDPTTGLPAVTPFPPPPPSAPRR